MPPQCSILIPFRNAQATLGDAVDSLRSQTFRDWELLLINDGSTDGGGMLADQMAGRDSRIRVMHLPPSGIVTALNIGLEHSESEVIARMDADDLCHPDRLGRQMEVLRSNPEVDLVSCRVAFGGDREAQAGYAAHVDWLNTLITHEAMFQNRFVDAPVAHPTVMFRRSAVERFGGYREGDFPEDFELWLRWLEGGARFHKLSETLLTWNDPPERLSRSDPRYAREAFYRIKCEKLLKVLPAERPIWLWGAGRLTRKRFQPLLDLTSFAGFVDVDPNKIGNRLHGHPVVGLDDLPRGAFVLLGVSIPGAREKIIERLENQGRRILSDFLPVA